VITPFGPSRAKNGGKETVSPENPESLVSQYKTNGIAIEADVVLARWIAVSGNPDHL